MAEGQVSDPIEQAIFLYLMLTCDADGCDALLNLVNQFEAESTVESWSRAEARKARMAGWSVDERGRILCPYHSRHPVAD